MVWGMEWGMEWERNGNGVHALMLAVGGPVTSGHCCSQRTCRRGSWGNGREWAMEWDIIGNWVELAIGWVGEWRLRAFASCRLHSYQRSLLPADNLRWMFLWEWE